MSDKTKRAFFIRELRNSIMSSLLTAFPGSIAGETIYLAMLGAFPGYDRTLCVKDLFYLEQKGYVKRKHPLTGKPDQGCEWSKAKWSLTAAGNEVANCLVSDSAFEV